MEFAVGLGVPNSSKNCVLWKCLIET